MRRRVTKLSRSVLADRERVADSLELLSDARRERRRSRTYAADLSTTVEVVCAVQRHVLGRFRSQKEQRHPQLRRVLFHGPATDSLHYRVVGDVLLSLEHLASGNLPAYGDILDVVQTLANEFIGQCCHCVLHLSWLGVFAVERTTAGGSALLS